MSCHPEGGGGEKEQKYRKGKTLPICFYLIEGEKSEAKLLIRLDSDKVLPVLALLCFCLLSS